MYLIASGSAPKANNDKPLEVLFKERKNYRGNFNLGNSLDLWYQEPTYGKVDFQKNSIIVSEAFLEQIPKTKVYCLNFVKDAFVELKAYFESKIKAAGYRGEIKTLVPIQGWMSVHSAYQNYLNALFQNYATLFFKDDNTIYDFRDFVNEFYAFFKHGSMKGPLTRSGFILSKFCRVETSGLVIDLDFSDKPSRDDIKFRYLSDPNYEFLKRSASFHGFAVDKNVPGRLIADLYSDNLKKYMAARRFSVDDPFGAGYYRSYESDAEALLGVLVATFNSLLNYRKSLTEIGNDSDGRVVVEVIGRNTVTLEQARLVLDEMTLNKMLLKMRLIETSKQMNDNQIEVELNKIDSISKNISYSDSQEYLNYLVKNG